MIWFEVIEGKVKFRVTHISKPSNFKAFQLRTWWKWLLPSSLPSFSPVPLRLFLVYVIGTDSLFLFHFLAYFFLKNKMTKTCVDPDGTDNGANVRSWTCDLGNSSSDQIWSLDSKGHVINRLSGKCLDMEGQRPLENGANLQLWTCPIIILPEDDFVYRFDYDTEGRYFLMRNVNTEKCLDVWGSEDPADGVNIGQYTCDPFMADTDEWWEQIFIDIWTIELIICLKDKIISLIQGYLSSYIMSLILHGLAQLIWSRSLFLTFESSQGHFLEKKWKSPIVVLRTLVVFSIDKTIVAKRISGLNTCLSLLEFFQKLASSSLKSL